MLDLTDEQRCLVDRILRKVLPDNAEIMIYGSRVTGKARPYSDLDIMVKASNPLTLVQLSELQEYFSESDLPFLVDITDWHSINNDFKARISEDSIHFRQEPNGWLA